MNIFRHQQFTFWKVSNLPWIRCVLFDLEGRYVTQNFSSSPITLPQLIMLLKLFPKFFKTDEYFKIERITSIMIVKNPETTNEINFCRLPWPYIYAIVIHNSRVTMIKNFIEWSIFHHLWFSQSMITYLPLLSFAWYKVFSFQFLMLISFDENTLN